MWNLKHTHVPREVRLVTCIKRLTAAQDGSRADRTETELKLLLEGGRIGGRQINMFIDKDDRLLLWAESDEKVMSTTELALFTGFMYEPLPLVEMDRYWKGNFRDNMIGLRFRRSHKPVPPLYPQLDIVLPPVQKLPSSSTKSAPSLPPSSYLPLPGDT